MRYLSIDLESTGLKEDCLIIEFAMVPFDTETGEFENDLERQYYIKCPPFEEIKKTLAPWVRENMAPLIQLASQQGRSLSSWKNEMTTYLESSEVKNYFHKEKIILFGKSLNAIDLPFLNRDLGFEWMRTYFHHRVLDMSSFCYGLIDLNFLPPGMASGQQLMKFLKMGDVAHTAIEDARNTAIMYCELLKKFGTTKTEPQN